MSDPEHVPDQGDGANSVPTLGESYIWTYVYDLGKGPVRHTPSGWVGRDDHERTCVWVVFDPF